MACLYVFPACPAEMLPTLQLKTGRLPVLTGSVHVRLVRFTAGVFALKYGQFVLRACLEVESWYLTRTGREFYQDKTVTLQDKMGSVTNKPYRSRTGWFPGGPSHSPDTESWKVREISNIFDILLIHHEKPGNYNRS